MLLEKYRMVAMPEAEFARFVLDEEKCTGCGRCVKACPIALLMLENKKARSNERYDHFRCITCQNCEVVCPAGAVTIEGDYRVSEGYWKNDDLYEGKKSPPEPFPKLKGRPFDEYEDKLTETEKVIYKRRSNRLFRKKQVPKELITRIIEAGRYAPSAGNNQPWKFIVIRNREKIQEIARITHRTLKFAPFLGLPHAWGKKKVPGDKNAKLALWQRGLIHLLTTTIYKGDADVRARGGVNAVTSDPDFDTTFGAPVLILLLSDKRAIGGTELDLGLCAQNMVLTAHALGLGTCYIGLIGEALKLHPRFRKELGITEPFEITTSIILGYPLGKIDNIVDREKARVVWVD